MHLTYLFYGHSTAVSIVVSKTIDLGSNPGARAKKEFDMLKIREYINESFGELINKVSWPTWSELTSSSIVVLVASLIIALVIFIVDLAFSKGMSALYETLF